MNWIRLPIKSFGNVITGKTPPTSIPEYFGSDYPFITPTDIAGTQRRVSVERFLSIKGKEYQQSLLLPSNAVCVVCIGATIGKLCLTDRQSFTNQQINSIVVDESKHSSLFVYYALKLIAPDLIKISSGAATPIINKSDFSEVELLAPPLPVQRRIAEVLGRYDTLIENYQRQIGLLEAMAQNLYREWFVRGRCPGAAAQADGLPVGWRSITIGEVCTIARGSSPRPINDEAYFVDGSIPWIKIADATASGKFLYETKEYVNEYGASFSRYLNEGSLIIATSGTLGFCTLLGVKGCVHDGWLYISEYREGVTPSFMYFVINSLTEYLNNLSYGAAIQNINTDILRATPMILPTIDALERFLQIIAPIDRKIDNLSKQLRQLRQMRDKLLPRLMSGQLAVEAIT
jgi:type I restriction enzyme S subunit